MELNNLVEKVKEFCKERNWDDNVQLEDLAKSIIIEAAELLEHFQWDASRKVQKRQNPKDIEEIGNEIADVVIYAIRLTYNMGFDLENIVNKKIERNGKKYPVVDKTTG